MLQDVERCSYVYRSTFNTNLQNCKLLTCVTKHTFYITYITNKNNNYVTKMYLKIILQSWSVVIS
jgi:hypothetical protein